MTRTFLTERLRYEIDGTGRVAAFADRASGADWAAKGSLFAYILPGHDSRAAVQPLPPSSVAFEGERVRVAFVKPAVSFTLRVREFPTHIRFDVEKAEGTADYGRFVFAGCVLTDADGTGPFSGSTLSLSIACDLLELPGRQTEIGAVAYAKLGAAGAAAALAGAPREEIRECLKAAIDGLTPADIPLNPRGGPFAADAPGSRGDYMIVFEPDFAAVDEWLKPFEALGVTQIDVHKGEVFRQGDFAFDPARLPGGAAEFRARFSDALHARGMLVGFHTYSAMVNPLCSFATPRPDPDLRAVRTYTLAEDLSATADAVPIVEETAGVPLAQRHSPKNGRCVVIDDEMITFSGVDGRALAGCVRGANGTTRAAHRRGATVRHLLCLYEEFQSVPGSPLFHRIAEATARTYDAGGFDMIYFDGLECVGASCLPEQEGLGWHYEALFVREVLRRVGKPPLVEYSTLHPLLWTARSRAGAFDYPNSGYRHFIDVHCADNEQRAHRRLLPGQLGWWNLYPSGVWAVSRPADAPALPNWQVTHAYAEDVDYLGAKSVAYESGLSYVEEPAAAARFPIRLRHAERLAPYARLRREGYFGETVRERLKPAGAAFRLVAERGRYGFERFERILVRPFALRTGENTVRVENPFDSQRPAIRIVARHGAGPYDGSPTRTLLRFDPSLPAAAQERVLRLSDGPLDLTGVEALSIRVRGNGRAEYMAVRLEGPAISGGGISDHVVPLDFAGWRTFPLCENDNEDFADVEFEPSAVAPAHMLYRRFLSAVPYDRIAGLRVLFSGSGGDVFLGDLRATPVVTDPVVGPAVTIGGETVSFDCALEPGSYLEYAPGDPHAIVRDIRGGGTKAAVRGRVGILPAGASAVSVSGEARGACRAKAHLIVAGGRLFNP